MRKFLKLIIVGSLFSSLCMPLCAQSQAGNPRVDSCRVDDITGDEPYPGNYQYRFPNGQKLTFSTYDKHIFLMVNGTIIPQASVKIVDNYSLVPLRILSEELGMSVQWEKKNQLVTIKKEGTYVEVITGKTKAKANGKVIDLETPATVFNGTVYVPVNFVAEAFSLSRGYAAYTLEGVEPVSLVLRNPVIFLDEKPTKEILSKQQALAIAKKEVTEEYNDFFEQYSYLTDENRYNTVVPGIKKDIEEMSVQGKTSRYWIIDGPKTILVDQYTGNVFFIRRGYMRSIDIVNGNAFAIFESAYFIE